MSFDTYVLAMGSSYPIAFPRQLAMPPFPSLILVIASPCPLLLVLPLRQSILTKY